MLKVSHDLDWEDEQPELFANIQTRLDPQERSRGSMLSTPSGG